MGPRPLIFVALFPKLGEDGLTKSSNASSDGPGTSLLKRRRVNRNDLQILCRNQASSEVDKILLRKLATQENHSSGNHQRCFEAPALLEDMATLPGQEELHCLNVAEVLTISALARKADSALSCSFLLKAKAFVLLEHTRWSKWITSSQEQ